jgi:hypothetical protein
VPRALGVGLAVREGALTGDGALGWFGG